MKLRNKKTGEVFNFVIKAEQDNTASYFTLKTGSGGWEDGLTYGTLEKLHEEWEDYKPTEPLIKDEKIRKAVRAWAEATRTTSVDIQGNELESRQNYSWIIFDGEIVGLVADAGDNYTIAELCGEEEE